MTIPAKPLMLQLLDRHVEVLKGIAEGNTAFYTVGEKVAKGLRLYTEVNGFPYDFVYLGSDHRDPEYLPDHLIRRYPTICITAWVDAENGDPMTKMLKHLADVQYAIEQDLRSGVAGSLGALCAWGHLGPITTDEGELGLDGMAGFRQDVHYCLNGDWGTI